MLVANDLKMINNKYWAVSELYKYREKILGKDRFNFICNIHSPYCGVYYLRQDVCDDLMKTDDYNFVDDEVFLTLSNEDFKPDESIGKINWRLVIDMENDEIIGFISNTDSWTLKSFYGELVDIIPVSLSEAIEKVFDC